MADPGLARVGIIGCGVIGAAWASRFVLSGVDVVINDPAAEAEQVMTEVFANATI